MALLLVSFACSGEGEAVSVPPTTSVPTSTTATSTPRPEAPVDWSALGSEPVAIGGGWTLADAEGEGPLFDVGRDGRLLGQLEVVSFPVETLDGMRETLAGGGTEIDALQEHAQGYLGSFRIDRAAGCGAGYAFRADPVEILGTPDGAAVRYGFTGVLAGGAPSERVLQFAGLRGEDLVILTATAADEGGCLSPEGPTFTTEQLDLLAPVLAEVVPGSGLPPAEGVADG